MWFFLFVACGSGSSDLPAPAPTGSPGEPPVEVPAGFVGSPCDSDADCDFEGGRCLAEDETGFPGGTCVAPCERFCPDREGFPTTFCVTADDLPESVAGLEDGLCLSRCDFEAFAFQGCREGYGCVEVGRAGEPDIRTYACLPGEDALTPCLEELAARGVPFRSIVLPDRAPKDAPDLVCHVEEPISFGSGYRGIDLVYEPDGSPGSVWGRCSFGHALADTLESVEDLGVTELLHLGAYHCRTIAGTSTLSRHGAGDAIDISGFRFRDDTRVTLREDWEHDTTEFVSDDAAWLYERGQGWHDDQIWNVILTPNYNLAHDDHFHVDLTPGSDFIGFGATTRYFGPAPYAD